MALRGEGERRKRTEFVSNGYKLTLNGVRSIREIENSTQVMNVHKGMTGPKQS